MEYCSRPAKICLKQMNILSQTKFKSKISIIELTTPNMQKIETAPSARNSEDILFTLR